MVDRLSKDQRSWNMSRIRSGGMKPEMAVRRLAHSMGFRYRLHRRDLPGKPDLVFPSRKKVIFVHGCFWHQHDDPDCKISRVPKSRIEYWGEKLSKNVMRDAAQRDLLEDIGWKTFVIWECQVKKWNESELCSVLRSFLN